MKVSKLIAGLDWWLLLLTLSLIGVGVFTIYSATHGSASPPTRSLYLRQLCWVGLGLAVMLATITVDYRTLGKYAPLLYLLLLTALAGVLVEGRVAGGARRWLAFGPLMVQPSELAKVALVLTLAKYYSSRQAPLGLPELIAPAALIGIPAVLVIKEPDLGTAAIYIFLWVVLSLIIGLRRRTLAFLVTAALTATPVLWWKVLQPYQKARLITLLRPGADPLGAGYHSLQAKIAVGSGGLLGKGFLAGTQSHLNFLPEKHTDFIFAVLAEETGYLGSILFVALYTALLLRTADIATRTSDRFGSLLVAGVATLFTLHLFFNVGMALGLTPVVGLPLPFISYGGSSLLTSLAGVGLVLNVRKRWLSASATPTTWR